MHLVLITEVPDEFDDQSHISHLIQQVLVLEFLRQLETHSLHKPTSALTVSPCDLVVDHFARFALQILHLVIDHSLGQNVHQSLLNLGFL